MDSEYSNMDPVKETLKHSKIQKKYRKKNFKCSQCKKRFFNKQTLKEHISTHFNIKPHTCINCGQKFTYGTQLSSHKRSKCLSLYCSWPKLTRLMIQEELREYSPMRLFELIRLPLIENKQEYVLPRLSELGE